jgi:dipeptidyl aminopeptidase/acylaminoacyl peptidase
LQLLANRGYAVLRVEFRGADGFGKNRLLAGAREWGGKMHHDVLDAVEWAVRQGIAERQRVGIFGWSYGGHETLAALTFTPDAFACGLAMYPVSDLNAMMETRNPIFFRRFWRRLVGDESTEEGRAFLKSRSPVHFVENITKPLLLTHGAPDAAVSRSHSDDLAAAMKKPDKPVTHLLYPDEVHDYRRKESWASLFAVAERFFQQHLGGRFEPMGEDLAGAGMEVIAGGSLIPGLAEARRPASEAAGH